MKKEICFLVMVLSLAACGHYDPDTCSAGPLPQGNSRLVAFGDSQTFGAKSCVEGQYFSWAYQVANERKLGLVMTAVPGTTFTDDAEFGTLMSFDFTPTDSVMMVIGFNDASNFGLDADHLALFKQNLADALTRVSPLVGSVVIGTCLHPLQYKLSMSPAAVLAYANATQEVVTALGLANVFIADVDLGFAGNPQYYRADDGVHILANAQHLVAAQMLKALDNQDAVAQ